MENRREMNSKPSTSWTSPSAFAARMKSKTFDSDSDGDENRRAAAAGDGEERRRPRFKNSAAVQQYDDLNNGTEDSTRPSKFPVQSEKDNHLRKVRSVLNKISSMNYHKMRKRWLSLVPADDEDGIVELIQLVVKKALDDQIYMHIYARMLGYSVIQIPAHAELICRTLNAQIHRELKTLTTDKEIAKFNGLPEQVSIARRKKVTIHRFIAELYAENVFDPRLLVERVCDLISYKNPTAAEENLECLCVILTFAGHKIDAEKGDWLATIFYKLKKKEKKEKLRGAISMRLQFMLQDLYELRLEWNPHNKWWPRAVRIQNEGNTTRYDLNCKEDKKEGDSGDKVGESGLKVDPPQESLVQKGRSNSTYVIPSRRLKKEENVNRSPPAEDKPAAAAAAAAEEMPK